jgi:hypothetical protein
MDRPTCGTCPYFDQYGDEALVVEGLGYCHRFPKMPSRYRATDGLRYRSDAYPEQEVDDWCGEHPRFPAYSASLVVIEQAGATS